MILALLFVMQICLTTFLGYFVRGLDLTSFHFW